MSWSLAILCKYKHSLLGQSKLFKKKLQYFVVPKEARNKCPSALKLSIERMAIEASAGQEYDR